MDIISTLILAIVSIAIGFVLSTLINNLRGGNEAGQTTELSSSSQYSEIARLWRERVNENLILEIDGKVYRSIDELSEEQQKDLVLASSDLRTWLRIFPKPAQISDSSAFTASIDEESSFPSYSPQSLESEPERPSLNPFQVFTRGVQESSSQETPAKSIVIQIDEILQGKLEGTDFKNRGIRLVEIPEEGMAVMVGMEKYKDVEDIPNEDIRNIIHAAVEEWEKGGRGPGVL